MCLISHYIQIQSAHLNKVKGENVSTNFEN